MMAFQSILFLLIVLSWSAVRGVGEGITFYLPNPRNHPWFKTYHWCRVFEAGLLIAAAMMYTDMVLRYIYMAGIVLFWWEMFELAYMIARRGQTNGHENILGYFAVNGVGTVLTLHLVRMLTGILLIWGWT